MFSKGDPRNKPDTFPGIGGAWNAGTTSSSSHRRILVLLREDFDGERLVVCPSW